MHKNQRSTRAIIPIGKEKVLVGVEENIFAPGLENAIRNYMGFWKLGQSPEVQENRRWSKKRGKKLSPFENIVSNEK